MTTVDDQTAVTTAAVARFNAAFDRHDVDVVMAAMSDDCVFDSTGPAPDGDRYEGAAAVRAVWERFFRANPHAHFEAEEQFAAGDRCVVRGMDVFRVRNGLVTENLCYVKGCPRLH